MVDDKNIMKYETILPEDFNGVFQFTNWSEEDFTGKWGGREYTFPKLSTSPMIIPEHSPLEIQNIRKKLAKDLAEREFFKSKEYARFKAQETNADGTPRLNSIHMAGTYSLDSLAPYIQRCLEPLPVSKAFVAEAPKPKLEDALSKDDEGNLRTQVVDSKTSLREKALRA